MEIMSWFGKRILMAEWKRKLTRYDVSLEDVVLVTLQ